jgi:hypothetical protein
MDILDPGTPHRPSAAVLGPMGAPRDSTGRTFTGREAGALRTALAILAEQMHEAVGRRRTSQPGTESFRRADERVAYLTDLFRQLQHRMTIPDEIWDLRPRPLD